MQGHLGCPEENWEAAHGAYLIWASAGQGIYIYIAAGWSFSSLLFFTLFLPNTADEILSLFRIRESIWLPESLFPREYGIAQGQDPVLFGSWCWDYWPEPDSQDVGTWESCLTVAWVGVSPAISCFPTCLLASHRKIIIFFQWRMTPITLKINCSIVWKYLSWISLTLVRAEHPQPRKGGWAVPTLNSALQMSVTCF